MLHVLKSSRLLIVYSTFCFFPSDFDQYSVLALVLFLHRNVVSIQLIIRVNIFGQSQPLGSFSKLLSKTKKLKLFVNNEKIQKYWMKIFRKELSKSLGGLAPVIPLRSYVLPSWLLIYTIAKDGEQNTCMNVIPTFVLLCTQGFRIYVKWSSSFAMFKITIYKNTYMYYDYMWMGLMSSDRKWNLPV